jgi:hypothetical protein
MSSHANVVRSRSKRPTVIDVCAYKQCGVVDLLLKLFLALFYFHQLFNVFLPIDISLIVFHTRLLGTLRIRAISNPNRQTCLQS